MTNGVQEQAECWYFKFGLICTGETEERHIPSLFRSLMATRICTFEVIRRTGQRGPVTSQRRLSMIGTARRIPDKDMEEIGFPARGYVMQSHCHFVIFVDDIEHDRRSIVQDVYERYRSILDAALPSERQGRASVHFLVNMIEAYYFGDSELVNVVLTLNPPLPDFVGDVEEIRNPKARLRQLFTPFDEVCHGGQILAGLDVERVLSNPATCAWLRTLFAWCVKALERHPQWQAVYPRDRFHLVDGVMSFVTGAQIGNL